VSWQQPPFPAVQSLKAYYADRSLLFHCQLRVEDLQLLGIHWSTLRSKSHRSLQEVQGKPSIDWVAPSQKPNHDPLCNSG